MLQKIDKEKCINCSKVLCCICSKKYEPDVFTELHKYYFKNFGMNSDCGVKKKFSQTPSGL